MNSTIGESSKAEEIILLEIRSLTPAELESLRANAEELFKNSSKTCGRKNALIFRTPWNEFVDLTIKFAQYGRDQYSALAYWLQSRRPHRDRQRLLLKAGMDTEAGKSNGGWIEAVLENGSQSRVPAVGIIVGERSHRISSRGLGIDQFILRRYREGA
jgi:hypothetical protein